MVTHSSASVLSPAPQSFSILDRDKVIAAVTPLRVQAKGSILSRLGRNKSTSETIRQYDENGPGVVGFYLDLKADVTGLIKMRIQRWNRTTMEWEFHDHPAANAAIHKDLVGVNGERLPDFVRHFAREIEAIGEVGFVAVPAAGGTRYRVVSLDPGSYEVVKKVKGEATVLGFKGTRNTKEPKTADDLANADDWFEVNVADVHRIYRPHPRWWYEPYTPLTRSLKDIRRYDNAGRAIHRAIASQLINGGILWFKGSEKDLRALPRNGRNSEDGDVSNRLGWLAQQIKSLIDAGERSLVDYDEEEVMSAMFHPVVTDDSPPQYIDVGKPVDQSLMEVKQDALRDFARSVNVPMSVLVEGQGAAQRMLNEWLQDKAFKETAILPDARRVAGALTVAFLHPRLTQMKVRQPGLFTDDDGNEIAVTDLRIWPDEAELIQEEPSLGDIQSAVELGVLSPEALVAALDAEQYALERPEGITDWDWWLTTRIATTQAAAEVINQNIDQDPFNDPETLPIGTTQPVDEPVAASAAPSWWIQPRG